MLPPWESAIIIYELEFADDSIIMDGPGDEIDAGYEEEFETVDGVTPFVDDVPPVLVGESVLINQVTIACR
jgi:hypothetical protein